MKKTSGFTTTMNRYYFTSFVNDVPLGSEWKLTGIGHPMNTCTWHVAPYPDHILIACRELGGRAFYCGIIGDGRGTTIRRENIKDFYRRVDNNHNNWLGRKNEQV